MKRLIIAASLALAGCAPMSPQDAAAMQSIFGSMSDIAQSRAEVYQSAAQGWQHVGDCMNNPYCR